MRKIKKIVSLCPALPGWRAFYQYEGEDEVWLDVGLWALVELEDAEQIIVPLTSGFVPGETLCMLQDELDDGLRVEFSLDIPRK